MVVVIRAKNTYIIIKFKLDLYIIYVVNSLMSCRYLPRFITAFLILCSCIITCIWMGVCQGHLWLQLDTSMSGFSQTYVNFLHNMNRGHSVAKHPWTTCAFILNLSSCYNSIWLQGMIQRQKAWKNRKYTYMANIVQIFCLDMVHNGLLIRLCSVWGHKEQDYCFLWFQWQLLCIKLYQLLKTVY